MKFCKSSEDLRVSEIPLSRARKFQRIQGYANDTITSYRSIYKPGRYSGLHSQTYIEGETSNVVVSLFTQLEIAVLGDEKEPLDLGATINMSNGQAELIPIRPVHKEAMFQIVFCFGEKQWRRR